MAANANLAETLARIEHKLDLLLASQGSFWTPMGLPGNRCPVCSQQVSYQMNLFDQMVTRTCGCGTGMQPPLVSFIPTPQGAPDARVDAQQSADVSPGAADGPRR